MTIDFASAASSPQGLGFGNLIRLGGVTLAQCFMTPHDGVHVGASQVTVGIYDGENFKMDWRLPDSDRMHSGTMRQGQAHLGDGRLPLWVRCAASPWFFAFAIDESFVAEVCRTMQDGASDYALQTAIGVDDPVLRQFALLARQELRQAGAGGRLFVEGLATSLTVHLLRNYGESNKRASPYTGGLAKTQLRRVIEYIDANIASELTLPELARVAGLSAHHFGQAFKATTGRPPHQYVIEKRIHRARELLRDGRISIAEIAQTVGFSSQSHLTINFRRVIGVTPARFRRSQI
ncbi:MAG: helix-turn-helix domain-containing protein [Stellaceae bacterium]